MQKKGLVSLHYMLSYAQLWVMAIRKVIPDASRKSSQDLRSIGTHVCEYVLEL